MLPVQLVETAAALTWSFLAMPSSNLDTLVPVVNARARPAALPGVALLHASYGCPRPSRDNQTHSRGAEML